MPAGAAARHVLALNCGSSSLKFGLYRVSAEHSQCLMADEHPFDAASRIDASAAMVRVASRLAEPDLPAPQAVGHRIVHGGSGHQAHQRIDAALLCDLQAAVPFAPLHLPAALDLVRGATASFPHLPQVACLDTAFHASMPAVASTLPLPAELRAGGLRRYGFHGLSCESIVQQFEGAPPERLLIAHLGGGSSITAVRRGESVDTSMGLTPAGGLPMATRSGDLDPGVLIHLMRRQQMDADALEDLLERRSGLLGLSGLSGDMRVLLDAADRHFAARLAVELFCYRVAKELGAMSVALGGAEHIVFTGGIGERSPRVRAAICAHLASLGVVLDPARNQQGAGRVTKDGSPCTVQVLPSREDDQIARHTAGLCLPT